MTAFTKQLTELIALTKSYLQQEFSSSEWTCTDLPTYAYYKQYAIDQKGARPAPAYAPAISQSSIRQPLQPQPQPVQNQAYTPTPVAKNPLPISRKPPSPLPAKKTAISATDSTKKKVIQTDEEKKNISGFQLEPLANVPEVEYQDIKQLVAEKFPAHQYINDIPSDAKAHEANNEWKKEISIPDVLILSFNESHQHQIFLQNLAHAIETYVAPAQVLSADKLDMHKGWDKVLKSKNLRLVLASMHGIQSYPELMKHFSETPKNAKAFLGNVHFQPLSDISIYLKNPNTKLALWQDLKMIR